MSELPLPSIIIVQDTSDLRYIDAPTTEWSLLEVVQNGGTAVKIVSKDWMKKMHDFVIGAFLMLHVILKFPNLKVKKFVGNIYQNKYEKELWHQLRLKLIKEASVKQNGR